MSVYLGLEGEQLGRCFSLQLLKRRYWGNTLRLCPFILCLSLRKGSGNETRNFGGRIEERLVPLHTLSVVGELNNR